MKLNTEEVERNESGVCTETKYSKGLCDVPVVIPRKPVDLSCSRNFASMHAR